MSKVNFELQEVQGMKLTDNLETSKTCAGSEPVFPAPKEEFWDGGGGPWKSRGNWAYPSARPPVDPAERL